MSVGGRIGIAFALGLVLLAAVGVSAYISTRTMLEANRWVVHTHEVEEKLEDLVALHLDAETDERAYLVGANEQYRKAYDTDVVRIRADLDAVFVLTRDNPSQQASLVQVHQLSESRLGELKKVMQLRSGAGLIAVLPILLSDRGKLAMDDLRAKVLEMESREQALLEQRNVEAQASASRALWTIAVWMPVGLILLAVLAVALLRLVRFGGPLPQEAIAAQWRPAVALRYAAAAAAVAVAAIVRWRLSQWLGPLPLYVTFFPAVFFAAAVGGGGPGILATLLSLAASAIWFSRVDAPSEAVSLGIFTVVSLGLSVVAERLRRSRWAEALSVAQHARAEELARKNEIVTQQAEELTQQAEELSQQTEELAQQNEELQTHAEEIRALNEEVRHRERLLETLMQAARLRSEKAAIHQVCEAAQSAFSDAAAAVLVCERHDHHLVIRAVAGAGQPEQVPEKLPLENSFVALVLQQNRTACLPDVSLRPDLSIFRLPGQAPFQAVLCAPMQRDGLAFGAVAVYSTQKQQWTEEQFHLVEWLAAKCAQMLEAMRAEAALAQAKAVAEEANRAKDRFLAVLSHELRTPLTPVVMGLSMLRDAPQLSPEVRETLAMIRRNIAMESRLIDDLLDVMRITRGKIELHRTTVALCSVISRAVEVCKADIGNKGLDFRVDLGPDTPYWIDGDAARLQQVFWNLLNNAVKFTPQGGCLAVRARRDDGHVLVEVEDSGIGIEPEALPRIFNAFEQGERSITRQFGGMGLGLTISRAMLEMHGGTIEALSGGHNRGATFRVRLPLVAAPAQSPPRPAADAIRPARPLRILLAEDHGATAQMLRMVLATDGHTVEVAGDLAMAVELAERQPFDLLLSDLGLPDGSGHDLLRELRRRGKSFPAIALSGFGQQEDVERSYEAGFAAHLTKPASRAALLGAINAGAAGDPIPAEVDGDEADAVPEVSPSNASPSNASSFNASPFNAAAALEKCLGKPALLQQMIQIYFEEVDRLLPEIEAASRRGDFATAGKLAHRLKGTMLHLAADSARDAAERVERLGTAADARDADQARDAAQAIAKLAEECLSLKQALAKYQAAKRTTSETT